MKRWLVCMAALGVFALVARPAKAELYYGFTVGVTKAPPAPVLRYAAPPEMVRASDAMVFVLKDHDARFAGDLFRFGQYWFAYSRGYWYRARDCKGPYSVIDVRNVPRAVLYVPRKHWKFHPKGQVNEKSKPALASASNQPQVVSVRPYPPGVPPAKPYTAKPAKAEKSHVQQKNTKDSSKDAHSKKAKKDKKSKKDGTEQAAKSPDAKAKQAAKASAAKASSAKASKPSTKKDAAKAGGATKTASKKAAPKSGAAEKPSAQDARRSQIS